MADAFINAINLLRSSLAVVKEDGAEDRPQPSEAARPEGGYTRQLRSGNLFWSRGNSTSKSFGGVSQRYNGQERKSPHR